NENDGCNDERNAPQGEQSMVHLVGFAYPRQFAKHAKASAADADADQCCPQSPTDERLAQAMCQGIDPTETGIELLSKRWGTHGSRSGLSAVVSLDTRPGGRR